MAIEILMPALSPTMTEGNLSKWLKEEGEKVKPGEVIAEIETDKATMEVEAADTGILGKIIVPAKTEGVKVNQLIAILLEDGEKPSVIEEILNKTTQAPTPKKLEPEPKTVDENRTTPKTLITDKHKNKNRIFATPLAKRIAEIERMELSTIKGSGPHGRIIKEDIISAKADKLQLNQPLGRNSQEYTLQPLSQMRKVIAKRLLESKQTIPHFYLTADCQIDSLLKLREQINQSAPKTNNEPIYKISVNDFVIKAAAHALKAVPQTNASWSDEGVIMYNNIDISVAVAIKEGLITPIIKNADQKSLSYISSEMKELANKAKTNSLKSEEFQGGGFTISNLGMYGIKEFKAIINPPQAGILAIGSAEKHPIVKGNTIEVGTIMCATLSCDHRVVDGAVGAMFLSAFKNFIENPALMIV